MSNWLPSLILVVEGLSAVIIACLALWLVWAVATRNRKLDDASEGSSTAG